LTLFFCFVWFPVLAALAAVVPLFSPYLASLPAVLELLIVDSDWTMAVLLLLLHLVPSFYVDTAIYSEIEGAHPYATALAIVGGAYLAGLEGAIFGPLLLCTLKFFINVYQSKISEI
jgi:predicted PurR-regulated permease PerM